MKYKLVRKRHNITSKDKKKKSSGVKHNIGEYRNINGINGMIFLFIVVFIGQIFRWILTVIQKF